MEHWGKNQIVATPRILDEAGEEDGTTKEGTGGPQNRFLWKWWVRSESWGREKEDPWLEEENEGMLRPFDPSRRRRVEHNKTRTENERSHLMQLGEDYRDWSHNEERSDSIDGFRWCVEASWKED